MNTHSFVALLKSSVLRDVLEVVTTNDDGPFHLVGHDHALKDTTTNGNIAREGALLIYVGIGDGSLWGLKS